MKNLELTTGQLEDLETLIRTALEDCYRIGSWSGWGVDILLGDESDEIYSSSQNGGNMVYNNSFRLCRVEQFEVEYDENGEEISIDCLIDDLTEMYVNYALDNLKNN